MKRKKILAALLVILILTVPTAVYAEGTNSTSIPTTTGSSTTQTTKSTNIGDELRKVQNNAAQRAANQQERNQIKSIYAQMRTIETTNHQTYLQVIAKRKQVRGFVQQVSQGKIAYSTDQLNQITTLSDTLTTDVQTLSPMWQTIKNDVANVKASCANKDYQTAITDLNTELADRQARGTALTKVSGDLDAMLAILTQGQAVANTSQTTTNSTQTSTN